MKKKLIKIKRRKRFARILRIRKKIKGTKKRLRLCVFRSNKHIYAQIINDEIGQTLASASDFDLEEKIKNKKTKKELAYEVGKILARKAIEKGIKKVVFDRRGYKFHGRIKALADGAKEEGLEF